VRRSLAWGWAVTGTLVQGGGAVLLRSEPGMRRVSPAWGRVSSLENRVSAGAGPRLAAVDPAWRFAVSAVSLQQPGAGQQLNDSPSTQDAVQER
jgi:hypothetical protein